MKKGEAAQMKSTTAGLLAVALLVVGIIGGYFAGVSLTPAAETITVTQTVEAGGMATTVTKTVTQTVQAPGEVQELTVYALWSGVEEENFRMALGAFSMETGIKINYISQPELRDVVTTQLAAGTSEADVIIAPWPTWIKDELGAAGLLEDVTDIVNRVGMDKFPSAYLDVVSENGRFYAVPFKAWAKPGFWYNKQVFDELGLKPPTTWDEFINVLDTLKAAGITPIASGNGVGWPLSDLVEAFIIGLGGPELQLKLINHEVAWTDPQVKEIFGRIQQLLKDGYFDEAREWTIQIDRLMERKVGIYFMGNWINLMLQERGYRPGVDYDVFAFPETSGIVAGGDWAFIPKFAKNKEAARKLLEFLAGAESQTIMVKLKGFLATNKDVPKDVYDAADRNIVNMLETLSVLPDLDDSTPSEFQLLFWDKLKELWANPDALDSVLEELEQKASEVIG
ncbi:MAG TPA: carbohydrate ABC transporter substrate-binding protein [Candidatus Caldiarchaeum subterraneum]|uniref:Carbohydrate ABC transporter substrate-binding protein n=1 Tax=Caldiarchaeum subterraneum TaxID=311458 RepID=A0A832ZW73_CALS0|nr:carbohydrate ABC transporter substrate-binding protein [Candidatus Caldarchaeum subterraneum]